MALTSEADATRALRTGPVKYGARITAAAETPEVTIVPANEASWEDLQAVFGTRGDPARCWCQRFKLQPGESWASVGAEELGASGFASRPTAVTPTR